MTGYKTLKSVNGWEINKTYEIHTVTGKIKPDTIIYVATKIEADGSEKVECYKTLKEAHQDLMKA